MPTDTELRAGLAESFGAADPAAVDELLAVCKIYALPPIELKYKYEAHLLALPSVSAGAGKARGKQGIDVQIAKELRRVVAREHAQSAGTPSISGAGGGTRKAGGQAGRLAAFNGDITGLLETLSTPTRPQSRPRPSASSSANAGTRSAAPPNGATPGSAMRTPFAAAGGRPTTTGIDNGASPVGRTGGYTNSGARTGMGTRYAQPTPSHPFPTNLDLPVPLLSLQHERHPNIPPNPIREIRVPSAPLGADRNLERALGTWNGRPFVLGGRRRREEGETKGYVGCQGQEGGMGL
ncbi:hypothetical protein QFC19_006159 [Naganishia cerealis]|uniref:Uncharacterized protein n=1 Tax=Naganishia cerealis TaxID=610337 RepID=A0ACC2VHQ2_9TREE|nr:hypothetical protein QFC19_006159 [Naganishia cerealis]